MHKFVSFGSMIFGVGLALTLLHVHFHTIILLVGVALSLAGTVLSFRYHRTSLLLRLVNIGITGWLLTFLFIIKFWPFKVLLVSMMTLLSMIITIRFLKENLLQKGRLLYTLGVFCITLTFLPLDTRYYLFNLRWSYESATDYRTWDKYSWFLYQSGKTDQAMAASSRALAIAEEEATEEIVRTISSHQEQIQDQSWVKYSFHPQEKE